MQEVTYQLQGTLSGGIKMRKKYLDLIAISYPLSNKNYVVAVNNKVLEDGGQVANNDVDINGGLEPTTVEILEKAGLLNRANKDIR